MSILVQPAYQFSNACVDQFHSAQFSDVCFQHHGIHPPNTSIDLHHLGSLFCQILDAVMIQIHSVGALIIITTNPKAGKALIT